MATHVVIDSWDEFEPDLRQRLTNAKFRRIIMIRNFSAERITLALETGTDRDGTSPFWNAPEFDHDHEMDDQGKSPDEIVYVHRLNWYTTPFTVLNLGDAYTNETYNAEDDLTEIEALAVYDSAGLARAAKNEHWFTMPPPDALMFVYSIRPDEE